MRTTVNFSFYCRKSKSQKNGLSPVEISIIINGKRVFIQLPRKEDPDTFKRAVGSKRNNPIKEYCNEIRTQLNDIQLDLMRNGIPFTADSVRDYFRTGGVKPYSVGNLWDDFLAIQKKRIGVSLNKRTYDKYIAARNIFYKYVRPEKEVTFITNKEVQNILAELKSSYQESSVAGIMTKIKTVVRFAIDNGKLQVNPFCNIKWTKGTKEIEYLTEEEIGKLVSKRIDLERLDRVRDLAVFQLSSGLAYTDTMDLVKEDICEEGGTYYIKKHRNKTGIEYTSVIFPEGVEVLKKYDYRLPRISNQKLNSYLGELETLCGITKNLHTHLFRKTYGTRLINRGVRIETVAKCLGHSSVRTSEKYYAKLLKDSIVSEVAKVF